MEQKRNSLSLVKPMEISQCCLGDIYRDLNISNIRITCKVMAIFVNHVLHIITRAHRHGACLMADRSFLFHLLFVIYFTLLHDILSCFLQSLGHHMFIVMTQ